VKYYTKEITKTLQIIIFILIIIFTILCIKYKPAYKVTISGETLGFVTEKQAIQANINNYINDKTNNIAFREIEEMPEYEFKFINRNKETKEREVLLAVEDSAVTTYRTYAVTVDGEEFAKVGSQNEAETIIEEVESNLSEEMELNLGIIEVFETDYNINSEEEAKDILNEVKLAKVRVKEAEKKAKSVATTTRVGATGNIFGMPLSIPVSGVVSSRFGSRDSSRASTHTGVDIRAGVGTGIRPVAPGTVTTSEYRGGYGNLIIVDHGNGVESYYAHCNDMYVTVGQYVDTNTTIGAVGSTGNSTGSHLHLEIRINGAPVNPQNYLY